MDFSPQAPPSMGFPRQEHWSGLPCLPPGDLPNPGTELMSLLSPALAGGFFTTSATWEAHLAFMLYKYNILPLNLCTYFFFLPCSIVFISMQQITPQFSSFKEQTAIIS